MKKIIYLGVALFLCSLFVNCSNNDDFPIPGVGELYGSFSKSKVVFNENGGIDTIKFYGTNWRDSVISAVQYHDILPDKDTANVGLEIGMERIGDTVKCEWIKLYHLPFTTGWDLIAVEAEPNTTDHKRFMRIKLSVSNYGSNSLTISQDTKK